jgi:uncharacterized protein YdeI (YjbR/CyaY-like superfamily)
MGPLRPDLPTVEVTSRAEWRDWLTEHHHQTTGVWVVTRKKGAVRTDGVYVSAQDINEECPCFGWIDSKPAKIDSERTALLCTPRKARSGWSKINKERLRRLLAEGLVVPAGHEVIAAAQADGSWALLDSVDTLEEPPDLLRALEAVVGARRNWDAFPPSTRRGILEWIQQARRDATRATRIIETARLAGENRRANQWSSRQ